MIPQFCRFHVSSLVCGLAAFFVAGCGDHVLPLDRRVPATSAAAFQQFRGDLATALPSDEAQTFDTAIQELKYQVMAAGTSGSDAIDAAVRRQIDGKTVREAIGLGLTAKLERLRSQAAQIDSFIEQNSQLTTRKEDVASANYLAREREQQSDRRAKLVADMADTEAKMKELGLTPPPRPPAAPAPATPATSTTSTRALEATEVDSRPQLVHP